MTVTRHPLRRTQLSSTILKTTTLFILASIFTGCANGNRRILRDMALGGLAGAALAQSKPDNRGNYTAMYAGVGAAVAGVVSVITSPDSEALEKENKKLQLQLDDFQKRLEPKLIGQGSSLFQSPLPKEVSGLVEPGEWKRFKLDQWIQDPNDSNTWYRQVEMFQINPPSPR